MSQVWYEIEITVSKQETPWLSGVLWLKHKIEYEPLSVAGYEKLYSEQQIRYLEKKVAKFGLQLVPT